MFFSTFFACVPVRMCMCVLFLVAQLMGMCQHNVPRHYILAFGVFLHARLRVRMFASALLFLSVGLFLIGLYFV